MSAAQGLPPGRDAEAQAVGPGSGDPWPPVQTRMRCPRGGSAAGMKALEMVHHDDRPEDIEARRAAARRTAWILAGVVVAIFVLAILQGVLMR